MIMAILLCFIPMPLLSLSVSAQGSSRVQLSNDVFVEKIDEGVWRHVSHKDIPGIGPFPSNGLIIHSDGKILMVDTAYNDEQTKLILDWIEKELKAKPLATLITHYHSDRLGGIGEVHKRRIETISSELTARLAKQHGLELPRRTFDININLEFGKQNVSMKYPGPGHTADNSVVWIPDKKILFGGCLIKSAKAEGMGNTADADIKEWPRTVESVLKDFGKARIVVPGHGDISGVEAITHTLELLKTHKQP
jgi:metallo-beta-lactamase class B